MIINLIRHGDPDYDLDRLTKHGQLQAELLAEAWAKENIDAIFSSPLGRAVETAQALSKVLNLPITELAFLREMDDVTVEDPRNPKLAVWNIRPSHLFKLQSFVEGTNSELFATTSLRTRMDEIHGEVSKFLMNYGIEFQEGQFKLRDETKLMNNICLFGHYGCHMAILSFLCRLDILAVWRSVFLDTSSVSKILVEKQEDGLVNFRILLLGDTSHLHSAKLQASRNGLQYNIN